MRTLGYIALGIFVGTVVAGTTLQARQVQSGAAAKELIDLLTKAKTDCVVTSHNAVFGGYIAALHIPGAKLTVVTARFADTRAMEYKVYHKDCMGAYADLSAAIDAKDRVTVDDINADGLIAIPKSETPRDSITRGGIVTKIDGDPKLLKKLKVVPEEFAKTFSSADETYTQLLRLLSAELKK
jgi:hypothetical protein